MFLENNQYVCILVYNFFTATGLDASLDGEILFRLRSILM